MPSEITTSLGYQIINHDINYNINLANSRPGPPRHLAPEPSRKSASSIPRRRKRRESPHHRPRSYNLPRHTIEAHPSTCVFRRPIYGFSPKRSKAPKAPKAPSHPPKRAQQSQYAKYCTPSACRSSTGKKKRKKQQHHPPLTRSTSQSLRGRIDLRLREYLSADKLLRKFFNPLRCIRTRLDQRASRGVTIYGVT